MIARVLAAAGVAGAMLLAPAPITPTAKSGACMGVKQWFETRKNAEGDFCCDRADGAAYYDGYQIKADGSVTLADGEKVPASRVLWDTCNPTGHAVRWVYPAGGTRCFAVGPGS